MIKADLKRQGNIILDADIMIAAIAIANKLTLVTNNEKHFIRIPNLSLENWAKN
jgi:tRNA(fMet)-specific endonuclease VapC